MTDTPTPSPETPSASSTPPEPRPRRPWTILGRLAEAVRRQDWFVVALEIAIVVLGVVIGFQVTAWGQAQSDRAQEQTYLRQLVEDLRQTEDTYEALQPAWGRRDSSVMALVRSFRSASTPPTDSVLAWTGRAVVLQRPSIVTGTADALVATGDINLIRNDSLRSRITSYIGFMDQERSRLAHIDEEARPFVITLTERVDFLQGWFGASAAGRERARTWPMSPMPGGPHRTVMPLDVEALLRDQAAYTAVSNLWRLRYLMRVNRQGTIEETVALREQIEAELTP